MEAGPWWSFSKLGFFFLPPPIVSPWPVGPRVSSLQHSREGPHSPASRDEEHEVGPQLRAPTYWLREPE